MYTKWCGLEIYKAKIDRIIRRIEKSTAIVGDFNKPLPVISKHTSDLNNIINEFDYKICIEPYTSQIR